MKVKVPFFVLILFCLTGVAQNPSVEWVKGGFGKHGISITTDRSGNVITTGNFKGTVDFDPGVRVYNLTTNNSSTGGIFTQKLDKNGNFIWAKKIEQRLISPVSWDIMTDTIGNVYTTGYYAYNVDFDPGPDTFYLKGGSQNNVFIQKLDSNGNFLWAKGTAGSYSQAGHSISLDRFGNIYITGNFNGKVDFDPGPDTFYLRAFNYDDGFILKLDANGDFLWANHILGNYIHSNSIVTDQKGNSYITGWFSDTLEVDTGLNTIRLYTARDTNDRSDIYIYKTDSSGKFIWIKQIGGVFRDIARSIAIDNKDNLYVTGEFSDTVDFDPGIGKSELISHRKGIYPGADIFVLKLDSDGKFLWVKQMGGDGSGQSLAITTDFKDGIYITGGFTDSVDFDPGINSKNLISNGSWDAFIQKLDTAGNFVWANGFGSTRDDQGYSISTDEYGNVFSTGYASDSVDFDPGSGVHNLINGGTYVLKLNNSKIVSIHDSPKTDRLVCYPNPTAGQFVIEFDQSQDFASVRLLSILGQELMNKEFQNSRHIELQIDQPQGMYLLEIVDKKGNREVIKVVKE